MSGADLVIANWQLGEEIGRGSFATVYIGRRIKPKELQEYSTTASKSSSSSSTIAASDGSTSSVLHSTPYHQYNNQQVNNFPTTSSLQQSPPPTNYIPDLVAIKSTLREKLNRKLAENLESEIKILKGIRHENIVSLLDIVVSLCATSSMFFFPRLHLIKSSISIYITYSF